MRSYLDRGYTVVKMKIGNSIAEDRPRIEGVLQELDGKAQLAVDANGRLTLEDAIAYAKMLRDYPLFWYEEAGDPLDFALQTALAEFYPGPMATGENLFSHQDARNLLRYGGMRPDRDFLQFDCALSYGLVEYLRTLEVLAEQGWSSRRVVPHGGHQMSLNIAAGLRLGGNVSYPDVFEPFGGFADSIAVEDGYVGLPDIPGIGLEANAARVEEAAHHGRGFVLGDDGGAGDAGAGLEVGAPMDRHLDRLAGGGIVDAAPALRFRLVRAFGRCRLGEGRRRRAHHHDPAQDLHLDAGDGAAVEPAIGILEGGEQHRAVIGAVGAHRQRHGDLVALAAIAHEGRALLAQRRVGHALAHDRLGLGAHLRQQPVGRRGVESVEALQPAAHDLVGDLPAHEAPRRAHPRIGGGEDAGHTELLGGACGRRGRRAARGGGGARARRPSAPR